MTRYSKSTCAEGQKKRPEQATGWQDLQPKDQGHRHRPYNKQNAASYRHQPSTSWKEKNGDKSLNLKKFGFNDDQEEELFTMLKKETRRENRRVKRQKNKQEEKVVSWSVCKQWSTSM